MPYEFTNECYNQSLNRDFLQTITQEKKVYDHTIYYKFTLFIPI